MKLKLLGMFVAVLMLVGILVPSATPVGASEPPYLPIIFVHGGAGSAQQFESQAMRFTSNGYPQSLLFAFEYDTGTPDVEGSPARMARLDAFIDAVRTTTGADRVYLIGHSRGTTEIRTYLLGGSDRQTKVAKVVQIDGTAFATPGNITTLAIWSGMRLSPPTMPGATNVHIPNQPHIEVATSPEAFAYMYEFFTGSPVATTDIVLEPCDQIKLAGRAVFFPWNRGVGDATVEIWEVESATGARIGTEPVATYAISGTGYYDGVWGPFDARGGQHYEFVLLRAGFRAHHFYFEPFIRSNHFVRLLTSPPGGVGDQMERNDSSVAMVISRQKEWWGDRGAQNDILTINGVNIINAATCPHSKTPTIAPHMGIVGIFAYDRYLDGVTNLTAPIPYFYGLTFMTGVDVYMPAAEPPHGTISLVLMPRGGGGRTRAINILNWASLDHGVTVTFTDHLQFDTTPPVVTITTPAHGAEYLLNSEVIADWTATDERCRLTATGTVPSGSPIDTSTVGTKTFAVTATDAAGNTRSVTHTYYVRYAYGGILPPINPDGSSIFKLGSTVQVKFQLRDANGAFVANAVARIFVQKTGDGGTEMEAVSSSAATTGNLCRYDPISQQYIFNLATRPLSVGTWQIRIALDDGTSKFVKISLK